MRGRESSTPKDASICFDNIADYLQVDNGDDDDEDEDDPVADFELQNIYGIFCFCWGRGVALGF